MEGYWGDESRTVDWAQNVVGALNALLENLDFLACGGEVEVI